nr:hypothetical protein [Abalone asfa-like virus]
MEREYSSKEDPDFQNIISIDFGLNMDFFPPSSDFDLFNQPKLMDLLITRNLQIGKEIIGTFSHKYLQDMESVLIPAMKKINSTLVKMGESEAFLIPTFKEPIYCVIGNALDRRDIVDFEKIMGNTSRMNYNDIPYCVLGYYRDKELALRAVKMFNLIYADRNLEVISRITKIV